MGKILPDQTKVNYRDFKSKNVVNQLHVVKRFRMKLEIRTRLTNI